jgi:hypothetical protein
MSRRPWSDRLQRHLRPDAKPIAVIFASSQAPSTVPPKGKVSGCQALEVCGDRDLLVRFQQRTAL